MTDASTTEAISANQIVGNSYLEIAKIQAQTAITIAESNVASAIAQHMQSAIEETITSTRESSDAMMLKFREMDAPKELIEKYRSSMESLIIESVKTLQEKAITKIQNAGFFVPITTIFATPQKPTEIVGFFVAIVSHNLSHN